MEEIIDNFVAKKIMKMSREELMEFLGEEKASWLKETLKNGTISIEEFTNFFRENFSNQEQADFIQGVVFGKLSRSELFNLYERDPEKQRLYAEVVELEERAKNGEITEEDLSRLCKLAFPDNPDIASAVENAFKRTGRIKMNENDDNKEKDDMER